MHCNFERTEAEIMQPRPLRNAHFAYDTVLYPRPPSLGRLTIHRCVGSSGERSPNPRDFLRRPTAEIESLTKAPSCATYRAVVPRVPYLRLFVLLCLTALVVAQVFGVTRGYECDCTGLMQWTAQDHCHGPDHDGCHRGDAPGHEHGEGDGGGERRDHEQVLDEVDSRLVQSFFDVPTLVPVLFAILGGEALWTAPAVMRSAWDDLPADTGPPPGVAVARTTVLLI
jgi:hypothetical protein